MSECEEGSEEALYFYSYAVAPVVVADIEIGLASCSAFEL